VNGQQTTAIVQVLEAAYPHSKKTREPGTLDVYRSFLAPLDYELAAAAVRDVIEESKWWPAWAEIRKAYDERAAARRRQLVREREHQERENEEAPSPSDAERVRMLDEMRAFTAARWGS
jgi:hypothetical protein